MFVYLSQQAEEFGLTGTPLFPVAEGSGGDGGGGSSGSVGDRGGGGGDSSEFSGVVRQDVKGEEEKGKKDDPAESQEEE